MTTTTPTTAAATITTEGVVNIDGFVSIKIPSFSFDVNEVLATKTTISTISTTNSSTTSTLTTTTTATIVSTTTTTTTTTARATATATTLITTKVPRTSPNVERDSTFTCLDGNIISMDLVCIEHSFS